DLYESYCGSILASAALGVAAMGSFYRTESINTIVSMQISAVLFPMALAGVGTLISIVGIFRVRTEENADQKTLLKALGSGITFSSVIIAVASALLAVLMFGLEYWAIAIAGSVVSGL